MLLANVEAMLLGKIDHCSRVTLTLAHECQTDPSSHTLFHDIQMYSRVADALQAISESAKASNRNRVSAKSLALRARLLRARHQQASNTPSPKSASDSASDFHQALRSVDGFTTQDWLNGLDTLGYTLMRGVFKPAKNDIMTVVHSVVRLLIRPDPDIPYRAMSLFDSLIECEGVGDSAIIDSVAERLRAAVKSRIAQTGSSDLVPLVDLYGLHRASLLRPTWTAKLSTHICRPSLKRVQLN